MNIDKIDYFPFFFVFYTVVVIGCRSVVGMIGQRLMLMND